MDLLSSQNNVTKKQFDKTRSTIISMSPLIQDINTTVHIAGHDLRAPLVVLRGYTQLLQRALDLPPASMRQLGSMLEATQNMEGLINALVELIDFQTLRADDFSMLRFDQIMEEVRSKIAYEHMGENTRFHIDFSGAEELFFSYKYLYALLSQLLKNALVHNENQPCLEISVRTTKLRNGVKLVVEDNGMGMHLPEGAERLYRPFYKHSVLCKRPGIGLSIVKTILDRTQGSISIQSELSKGTKCILMLRCNKQNLI